MTYCLGWKTGSHIVLTADSVITSNFKNSPRNETIFEEPHLFHDDLFIEERALKLYRFKNLILTYSGNTLLAHNLNITLKKELDNGVNPRDALKTAIGLNLSPPYKVSLICGFFENNKPILLSFNNNGSGLLEEHDRFVQMGSVFDEVKKLTRNLIEDCIKDDDTIQNKVVQLLAAVQLYGRMGPLILSRAGGVFSSLYINENESYWQPDILYILSDINKILAVGFRDNHLIVYSPLEGLNLSFSNNLDNLSSGDLLKKSHLSICDYKIQYHNGKFDYVVNLNVNNKAVSVVIEMCRKKRHKLLWVIPERSQMGIGLKTLTDPILQRCFKKENKQGKSPVLFFYPYEKPGQGGDRIGKYCKNH